MWFIIILLWITRPKYLLQHTVSSSSGEPNISCFLSKMHNLTCWQLCQTWWNASCKLDKEAWLNVFWKNLKESRKIEWARAKKTDELLLERIKGIMYSRPAQLKFDMCETSSEMWRNQPDFVTHSAPAQNHISIMWCTM